MQKVDRLGWVAGFSIKSYGVRIGIRSNEPLCLKRVCDHLPHGWEAISSEIVDRIYSIIIGGAQKRSGVRRFNLLYGDHVRLATSVDVNEVFHALESDLRLFVAEVAHHRVFVHAGVVGWKGSAIVIPGRSFSGKSTLVAELVKAGATYYSDEYAVLDSQGRVHPFLKPLEIREHGATRQTKVFVNQLGGQAGKKALPAGLVIITHFQEGGKWRPRRLSPGKGTLELLANTVSARSKPEQALAMLQQVAAKAQILKGVRGHATEIAHSILKKAEQHP
jgi:serine kinase of HPr protein (carbohydrate metabolism regulator)